MRSAGYAVGRASIRPGVGMLSNPNGKALMPVSDLVTVAVGRLDPLVLLGLIATLCGDPCVRILAADLTAASLERAVAQQAPRVVILNEAVEHSLLGRLTSREPPIGVVVLAHDPTRAYGMQVLGVGATCVAQNASSAEILAAVRLAAQGERRFLSADGHRVEPRYPSNARLLTPREREVLRHRSRGASYAQIALAMGISVETVKKHAAGIRRKLGVHSTRELIGTPMSAPPVSQGR
jgi:DNA-binding NarL/FixJ family response regulator